MNHFKETIIKFSASLSKIDSAKDAHYQGKSNGSNSCVCGQKIKKRYMFKQNQSALLVRNTYNTLQIIITGIIGLILIAIIFLLIYFHFTITITICANTFARWTRFALNDASWAGIARNIPIITSPHAGGSTFSSAIRANW